DLYTPLYVPRPTVVPELFASLQPVAYSGSIVDGTSNSLAQKAQARGVDKEDKMEAAEEAPSKRSKNGDGGKARLRAGLAMPEENKDYAARIDRALAERLELSRSVSSAASAARLGDFFQYAVDRPVSLARQKSALLPIVGKDVQASRVSIYNERTQA